MYCRKCGKQVDDNANFCPYCGENLTGASNASSSNTTVNADGSTYVKRNRIIAGVLNILIAGVGRMYAGYVAIGVLQLLAVCLFGAGYIWSLIDGILILTGTPNCDGNGVPFSDSF